MLNEEHTSCETPITFHKCVGKVCGDTQWEGAINTCLTGTLHSPCVNP